MYRKYAMVFLLTVLWQNLSR